jgi:hypothetical protein
MRRYYLKRLIGEGNIPIEEDMIAYLLDECVLMITDENDSISLTINVSDYFYPGADDEKFPMNDIPKIYELYKEKQYKGICEYVAEKRKIENISWKDKLKSN